MRKPNDVKLDTISVALGYGIQLVSTQYPLNTYAEDSRMSAAHGVHLHVFAASSTDDGAHSPAESCSAYLNAAAVDQLIELLKAHRARLEKPE